MQPSNSSMKVGLKKFKQQISKQSQKLDTQESDLNNDTILMTQKTLKTINKHQETLISTFYKKKSKSLIIQGVSFGLASKYEALLNIIRDREYEIKVFGVWDCNITSQKIAEIFTLLRENHSETMHSIEISDNIHVLKKSAIQTLGELFHNKKLESLSLQHNDIRMDGCLHIGSALVFANKSLKVMNLNGNRVGTKGLQLLIESLKENAKLESLFLNDNFIDDDGAQAICSLLSNQRSVLKELHIAMNGFSQIGLNQIFDTITNQNRRLKYLDVAHNIIEIGILRSFRNMLEKNSTLQYLSISDLYKFNQNAVQAIQDSLLINSSLKLLDLKKCTREFYEQLQEGVNTFKGKNPIIFLKETGYVKRKIQTQFDNILDDSYLNTERDVEFDRRSDRKRSQGGTHRSYTPQKALEESRMKDNQILVPKRRVGRKVKKQAKPSVEMIDGDKMNIRTPFDEQNHIQDTSITRSAHSLDYSQRDKADQDSPNSSFNYTFQRNSLKNSISQDPTNPLHHESRQSLNYVSLRSPSREALVKHHQEIQKYQKQLDENKRSQKSLNTQQQFNPHESQFSTSNAFGTITDDQQRQSIQTLDERNYSLSKSPKRVQFANDIKIFREKKISQVNNSLKSKGDNVGESKSNKLQSKRQLSSEKKKSKQQAQMSKTQSSASIQNNKINISKYGSIRDRRDSNNMNVSIQSNGSAKKGILKSKRTNTNLQNKSDLENSIGQQKQSQVMQNTLTSMGSPSQYQSLDSNVNHSNYQSKQSLMNNDRQNSIQKRNQQKNMPDSIFPQQKQIITKKLSNSNFNSNNYNSNINNTSLPHNQSTITSQYMDESTSFALSPEEKENLKYNMKNDKVVVFYKKILGEIRDVIREERQNIKKYLN
eukprot:403332444